MAITTTTTAFEEQYQRLNAEQRRAVDAIEGVVMVLAGPGTGKTQIVALRVAKILKETQMDPYNILCLTFTESGVTAMRKRLISIIGTPAYYVRIHTFHSFCNDIIQEHPEKFSFARDLEVLSDLERVELFREIIDELSAKSPLKPYANSYLYLPDLTANVQRLKQEHVTTEGYRELVDDTAALAEKLAPAFEKFLQATSKTRDPDALYQAIAAQRPTHPRLAAHFVRIEKMWTAYQERIAGADGAREAQKLTTKWKNDMKRWFEQLQRRLPKQREMEKVYEAYQRKIRERGRYDYEDMILFVVERFKQDDELLARYQEQFQYILVDEYQDTNGAQNETVALLGQFHDNPNIFVVGDDKQSVYRFQGASLENLLYLYRQYQPQVQVIVLRDNYRSQQAILDAAHAVIRHNRESVDQYLPATTQALKSFLPLPAVPVAVHSFDTPEIEAYFIGQKIKELLTAGVPPGEIAVLYRRNAEAADLAEALLKMEVPVQVERGDNVLDDILLQQLLDVLRYVAAPQRPDLLWKVLHFDFWQLPALDVIKVQSFAVAEKLPLLHVIGDSDHLAAAGVGAGKEFQEVAHKLAHWHALAANSPLPEFLAHVVQESGLFGHAVLADDHVEVLNRITTLFHEAKRLSRRDRHLTLADFLAHLQLMEEHQIGLSAERLQTKLHAVCLMTAHKAKGLEFEHVFITRAVDRNWGNVREHALAPLPQGILRFDPVAGAENNEDERRLFYVAMTRAKRQLYITHAAHSASGREQVPTIFLEEIPANLRAQVQEPEAEEAAFERLRTLAVSPVHAPRSRRINEFLQGLLTRYVLSPTHLNAYLECPRLFYYKHLLRVPYMPTKHMVLGTAVHEALRDFCAAATAHALPSRQELLARYEHHLRRETLGDADFKDTLELGTELLGEYYDAHHATLCRRTLLEYNFGSHGVTLDGIPITGKIDKIEIIDEAAKRVNVVDYKTAHPDKAAKKLQPGGEYHRQLTFYKVLCDNAPRFPYTMASGEIDFIQKSEKTGAHVKKPIVITAADVRDLTEVVQRIWEEIQSLAFLDRKDAFCGECEFCLIAAQGHAHHVL